MLFDWLKQTCVLAVLILLAAGGMAPAWAAEQAADVAARIAQRVGQQGSLRAQFIQTKTLAAMKRPIVTQGHVLFMPGQGAIWRIEQPLQMTYVLKEDRVLEIDAQGKAIARTAQNAPGLKQVSQILRAVMGARIDVLRNTFTVEAEESAGQWTLRLTPRDARVAQFIQQLTVHGGQSIDSLLIQEGPGDSTQLQFRGSESGVTPTAQEARWLEAQ